MTRNELLTAVRSYSNRPTFPENDFDILLRIVEGYLNKELRDHPRNIKSNTVTLSDNSGIIPLPDDLSQLITVSDDDGIYDQFSPALVPADDERGFIQRGMKLQLYPNPGAGARIYLYYHSYLTPLMAVTSNWVSTYHADVYLYGCLIEVAIFVKDDVHLQTWREEFLRRLDVLKAQGWNQNIASAPRILSR